MTPDNAVRAVNTREIENAAAVAAVRAACTTGQARRIRKGANLSLQMVARAIGVSHTTVMRWEGATNLPTGPRALGYSRLLARLSGGALDVDAALRRECGRRLGTLRCEAPAGHEGRHYDGEAGVFWLGREEVRHEA